MTCCFFSSLKTLLTVTEDSVLTSAFNVLDDDLQLAGFQVTLTGRFWVTPEVHVFDRVVLVGEELNEGVRSDCYQVHLSQWQLTNLNQGYLLPLDFNAYLKLKRDIAKALFGHLSVWFYASRGQPI